MKLSVSAYRAHASAHKKILSSYQSTLNYGSTSAAAASTSSSAGGAGSTTQSTSITLFSMDPALPSTSSHLAAQYSHSTSASGSSSAASTTTLATTAADAAASAKHSNATQQHSGHQARSKRKSSSTLHPPTGSSSQTAHAIAVDAGSASPEDTRTGSMATSKEEEDSSNAASSDCKSPGQRTKSNQRWMKLRTTVQISGAMQKKPTLKREDSFLKRFSTRQIPETQETMEETGSESASGDHDKSLKRRRRYIQKRRTVVNPDENFHFYWLMMSTVCVLYNLWTLIVRQSFPELQELIPRFWTSCDRFSDGIFVLDIIVQLRTGYLEQGLMVYNDKKLALHYMRSKNFLLDCAALLPLDLLQLKFGTHPLLRFPRFFKVYRSVKFYYIVESRTVWPNLWRVVNLIHILLILAHWFGCFYFLLSEAEGFQGDWVYPYRPGDYATLSRKYLGSLYWSTLTLTTIGDLPTPETNAEYIFTIVSYLIGVFIFATIVGQVGNVITNRNANRLEFERLLDGAKTYMRHHKVPGGMKRRVLRWYDYSWSRGRIQGGGDINTALGLLPDKLKTELALHVNLSVLKKVTIFQECQPEFLHDLVLKMKAYIFTPGDSICRKGEVAREMFIIADGILEVLSETGKVLTTMKAGDFFGEIGILNLDGLNKRTADVRSVGYSELFSLSREDVLAAMKDYPEAQDILQTLGRKRLMEVRCVNKKHAKLQAEKESIASNVKHAGVVKYSEKRTSQRIVDKLRCDVKGLKNVIRKTRLTGRRSNESIELQPLHSGDPGASRAPPKGVLRRMPRVRSDEINADGDAADHQQQQQQHHHHHPHHAHPHPSGTEATSAEQSRSPIGAGLPLLQRLLLLKEKQQSIQEEPEVIGAGLPMLQRLKLLRAKELRIEKEKLNAAPKTVVTSSTTTFQSASSTVGATASAPLLGLVAAVKPKVSFRDRIKAMQSPGPSATGPATAATTKATVEPLSSIGGGPPPRDSSEMHERLHLTGTTSIPCIAASTPTTASLSSSHPASSKPPSTLTTTTFSIKEKLRQLSQAAVGKSTAPTVQQQKQQQLPTPTPDEATSLKPWSKLKLATVVSTGGSYSSLNSSSLNEDEGSPTAQLRAVVGAVAAVGVSAPAASDYASDSGLAEPARHQALQVIRERRAAEELSTGGDGRISDGAQYKRPSMRIRRKVASTRPLQVQTDEPKHYQSVDDLSPEYSGLPFVKKLKILNERQRLAALESALQTRSVSLDYADPNGDLIDSLIRSHSEASGMVRPKKPSLVNAAEVSAAAANWQEPPPQPPPPPSQPPSPQLCLPPLLPLRSSMLQLPAIYPQYHPLHSPPVSPSESANETPERLQLKSILKKLSAEKHAEDVQDRLFGQSLMRAPTLEGPPDSARSAAYEADVPMHGHYSHFAYQQHHQIEQQTVYQVQSVRGDDSARHSSSEISPRQPVVDHPVVSSIDQFAQKTCTTTLTTTTLTNKTQATDTTLVQPEPTMQSNAVHPAIVTKKFVKDSIEDHEYFGEVLLGIKHVIQNHLREVQMNFQDRFLSLELDVRQRDVVIGQLQHRIRELERGTAQMSPSECSVDCTRPNGVHSSSSSSSYDTLFARNESAETVYGSTQPYERARPKHKSKTRSSPRRQSQPSPHPSEVDHDDNDEFEDDSDRDDAASPTMISRNVSVESIQSYRGIPAMIDDDDEPENASRIRKRQQQQQLSQQHQCPSVVLNIGRSSEDTASSSSNESGKAAASSRRRRPDDQSIAEAIGEVEEREDEEEVTQAPEAEDVEDEIDDDDDDDDEQLHCDDWEIRMLAAEMNRRESEHAASTSAPSSSSAALQHRGSWSAADDHGQRLLRRRHHQRQSTVIAAPPKHYDDTESSDGSGDHDPMPSSAQQRRPRASSLDQHNLRQSMRRQLSHQQQHHQQQQQLSSMSTQPRRVQKSMSFDRDKDRL